MAFGFSNVNNGAASGAGGLTQGADLEVISTERLGFLTLAGDAKVQLTSRWSPEPAPTANLISIASRKGLVAAAGPDAVHIATTESVRKAFESDKKGDSEVRPFEPQAKLPLPFRISQLAFTSDEQYLILSAETGGGLAVYDVQALTNGSTQSAFELSTNNEPLRALIPNPSLELAGLCAVVTTNGNLFIANLAEKQLVSGANGPVSRSQVSCAAWSTKGKQLVAGMADGSISQMTPDGTEKAHIPKPPSLGDYHVSSLSWLENNVFLVIHNSTNGQDPAVYHLITRQPAKEPAKPSFTFQKATDPVEPFTADKAPHHTVLRLKDFPPNLQDVLMISSTATESIGLMTRAKEPLTSDGQAELITGVFTTTELGNDSTRAQLPMGEDLNDTYPIGSAIDLSSKNKVYKPIPADEIELSPGPLPGLWVLNNEGVLAAWWIVYHDSIRGGTVYPELSAADTSTPAPQPASTTSALPTAFSTASSIAPALATAAPAFGTSSLGVKSSPWATASATTPSFGSSAFASAPKPAVAAPAFGAPAFGTPSAAPAFGQSSSMGMGMGAKASPWAAASTSAATPSFGQSGFASAGATPGKVFGSAATSSPGASGGFASFASKGGFGSVGATSSGPSIFASKPGGAFASTPEVSMDQDTAFPPPSRFGAKPESTSPFASASPFVLGSTFKPDPKAAEDEKKAESSNGKQAQNNGSSLFGGGFGLSLNEAAKEATSSAKDQDMDVPTPAAEEKPKSVFSNAFANQEKPKSVFPAAPTPQDKPKSIFESTTPTATPAAQKFDFKSTSGSSGTNLFGAKPASAGTSSLFGSTPFASGAQPNIFGTPKIKKEEGDKENLANIPEAPLPPDTTSKAVFPFGDFSSSSSSGSSYSPYTAQKTPTKATDAPLPPAVKEETSTPKPAESKEAKRSAPDDMPLPPDFLPKPATEPSLKIPPAPDSPDDGEFSSEEEEEGEEGEEEGEEEGDEEDGDDHTELASEGSGVDVAKDLSPSVEFTGPVPGFTPQSSFGGMAGSSFSNISRSEAEGRSLFGEIKQAPPLFPKPVPQSPRSPSPVRSAVRPGMFNESARSFSAPGLASQFLGGRKSQPAPPGPEFGRSILKAQKVDPNVEAQRKHAAKREAEEKLLVDPEDEGIQQILHSELEPTLHMNEFLAVDQKLELMARPGREDVPVHCEALWRDINRMIDRLGLNSRSLQSFILGHSDYKDSGRHKDDLENPDDWVLVESEDLGAIIDNELVPDLEDGRLKNIDETEAAIQALSRDLGKLRAKEDDLRRLLRTQTDPDQVAIAKSIPLSAEQSSQQNELRRAYLNFTNLLAEAEEALTMLKTKLASVGGGSGKTPVPTVEAIIRTINKMTTMAEKRSGDIDVLENQMRRLRFSSVGLNGGNSPARSREGSPFVGGGPAGLLATPSKRASMMSPERMRDSLASSVNSYRGGGGGGTPRKKLSMFTEEEKKAVRTKANKRKEMLNLLRTSLEKAGPNVSRLRDDD